VLRRGRCCRDPGCGKNRHGGNRPHDGGRGCGPSSAKVCRVRAGEVRRPISITEKQPPVLDVRGLCVAPSPSEPRIENISFTVGRGEILGIAGIVGNGLRSLAGALAGRVRAGSGAIIFDGSDITALAVADGSASGFAGSGKPSEEALLPDGPLWENFLLGRQREGEFRGAGLSSSARPLLLRSIRSPKTALRRGGRMSPFPAYREETCRRRRLRERFARPRLAILEQPSRGLDLHAAARMREGLFA